MINAYNKQKAMKVKQSVEIKEETDSSFTHVVTKVNGFADILK